MVSITGVYEGDLHCQVRHVESGMCIATDAPLDNQGRGESFSPTDLCATALLTCMATIMGIEAAKMGIDLRGMRMRVDKHMSRDKPRRISRLDMQIEVPLILDSAQQERLRGVAENCPVHHSLNPEIEKRVEFFWAQEARY